MRKVSFIGGKDFDTKAVGAYLERLPKDTLVVTGNGQGLEGWVREQAPELGLRVFVPELRPDLYDYRAPGLVPVGKKNIEFRGGLFWLGGKAKKIGLKKVNRALEMQVYDVFIEALGGNTLVLVGDGTRPKLARQRFKEMPAEAWGIGLVEL